MVNFKALASVLLASATLASARPPRVPPKGRSGPNYWFSFGDSYTQTWFNHTDTPPAPGNPLGNPPYPGWTATGGPNWVGYLTTEYNNSLVLTWNYAYGGAVIDDKLVTPWQPGLIHLTGQVDQFLEYAAKKPAVVPWTSKNALFSIFIGINDIGNSWWLPGSRDEFNDVLLDAYFGLVQKLYDAGGRNFLFVNVPPIDRSPLMLEQTDDAGRAIEKEVIASYNRKLLERIEALKATDRKIKTFFWDSNAFYTKVLDSPQEYGFKDATSWGKEDPEIFWGDNYHPSTYADKLFAEDIARNVLADTVW
ncbi:fungal cellulose binding domain-containing protein [Coprinopsis cinerea okayama7|uniref:Fungal cellulose binding domain-containing protein n=1 Tax=Coprinopsis cinerea (strain Okayama-7 / 130 / ATCC MYA-4618 / FGSC 9003) TaxID=240176 RepID=A8N4M7_COPC7|nr:fungal cellulose binding domain-containing protein [Coprinopsis cinerea okayama7\|eukprot:XP_001829796.1 fungal cellulose binding domain-containing protein [Coprinopsis cinerea okayama7\